MAEVKLKEGESLDSALRRFKRQCARSGVLAELRKREHYETRRLLRSSRGHLNGDQQRQRRGIIYPKISILTENLPRAQMSLWEISLFRYRVCGIQRNYSYSLPIFWRRSYFAAAFSSACLKSACALSGNTCARRA